MPIAVPSSGVVVVGGQITNYYQYEINGLLLGSRTDFVTTKVEGLLGKSDIKTTDVDRQDGWGEFPGRDLYKGRRIVFTIDIKDDFDTAQHNLDALQRAWSVPDTSIPALPVQLVFYRPWTIAGQRFYWARPGRMAVVSDAELAMGHAVVIAEIKTNDPRSYSMVQNTDTLTIPTSSNTSSAVVTNNGDTAAAPILTIGGPCINPQIANFNDASKIFKMTISLLAGDTLAIDFRLRTILKNGVDVGNFMSLDSQWWKLQPGINQLVYGRTDFTASSTLQVAHRDTWS